MREPKVCCEGIYQTTGKGRQGCPQRGLSHGIAGELVHPNGEDYCVPSKSIQWSTFPHGDTVLSWPLYHLFAAPGDKDDACSTPVSVKLSRNTTVYQLFPGRLAMVDTTYYLKRHWKDNWEYSVGGKFIQSFCIFS
jgi:hypothetical protein